MGTRAITAGRYTVTLEDFPHNGVGRERPIKVVGPVPTNAVWGAARGGDQPIALYNKMTGSVVDSPLHNTVRGHLVGLDSLGGEDSRFNMVPMYNHFNISGYKSQIENWIKAAAQQTHGVALANLTLTIAYPVAPSTNDPRIPEAFEAKLDLTFGDRSTKSGQTGRVVHPIPQIAYTQPVDRLGALIEHATEMMIATDWWVEDNVLTNARATFASHERLVVPDKTLGRAHRPYAVIDFLIHGQTGMIGPSVGALLPQITTGNVQPDYTNGADFSEPRKAFMYAVNLARNGGYYRSDDRGDYVYKGKSHGYTSFPADAQARAKSYRHEVKAMYQALEAMEDWSTFNGVLVWEGGHQKPEVDHIVPQTGRFIQGCNAYSNARVVSSFLNNERRTRR
jgi:hypothetical protein